MRATSSHPPEGVERELHFAPLDRNGGGAARLRDPQLPTGGAALVSELPRPLVASDGAAVKAGRGAGRSGAEETETSKEEKRPPLLRGVCEPSFPTTLEGARGEAGSLRSSAAKPAAGGGSTARAPSYGQSASQMSVGERSAPVVSPLHARPRPIQAMPTPKHWSVFYPDGIDNQPPLLLHYLVLGGWRTVAGGWDYFSHRRLQDGEVIGHQVRWLHNAQPRDRFVFVVSPVEPKSADGSVGRWQKFRDHIYGPPPAFAYNKGKLFKQPPFGAAGTALANARGSASLSRLLLQDEDAASPTLEPLARNAGDVVVTPPCSPHGRSERQEPKQADTTHCSGEGGAAKTVGVEVIEVRHEDVTATDYGPRLSSSRFAIEAKAVYAYYFASVQEAFAHYDCLEELRRMEEQIRRGVTNRMPLHHKGGSHYRPSQGGAFVAFENVCGGDSFLAQATMGATPPTPHGSAVGLGLGKETPPPARGEATTESFPTTTMDESCITADDQTERQTPWNEAQLLYPSSPESLRLSGNAQQLERHPRYSRLDRHSLTGNAATMRGNGSFADVRHPRHRDGLTLSAAHPTAARSRASVGEPVIRPRLLPTLTTAHFDTIVTVYSEDPNFNAVLREVLMPEPGTHPYTVSLKEQRRMLSMYETGMPAWTIFLASTGLPYRRVFRLIFVGLVNIWPLISLFVGLYDLYKHLPQMKTFLSTTMAPLLGWVDEHFTFRVSMLVTYIISVGVTVAASFTSFLSQFYILEVILYPLRILAGFLQTPFALLFELLWSIVFIIGSFVRLLFVTLKMVFVGPFLLVAHVASWEFGSAPVIPVAVEGTSLTLKWWRAWQEFWVTVASPVKNLAKAWYDSVVHVAVSAARREASIRRWYTPKLSYALAFVAKVREVCVVNIAIWWQLCGPGWGMWLLHTVLFAYALCLLLMPGNGDAFPSYAIFAAPPTPLHGDAAALTTPAPAFTEAAEGGAGDAALPMEGPLPLGDIDGNGFDALYFAWETLIAVWVQLPW
ncbi:uncharacterized protein Tco025E_06901 [Trypanosoma conorhini]|uniref:Transmembrane protein n=1 Tax=Trypanosoma conorhini TaxID=83891 RepID=A0A422NWS2_9TRYP|nr:uncharacterized protein Tco025E_06901 [Trypanosoma conorhini]RNF09886.1 hypothetical protein Tco025E_06901 [Trypanosoma conorhini]